MSVPVLVYDGDCGFCVWWIRYWRRLTGEAVDYRSYQSAADDYLDISVEEFRASIQLIDETGTRTSGARAAFTIASYAGRGFLLWLYRWLPGFAWLCEHAYTYTSTHRDAAFRLARLCWGKERYPDDYVLVSWLFLRLLGLIYLAAFVSFGVQAQGLIGSHGILPLQDYVTQARLLYGAQVWWNAPGLFLFDTSDRFLQFVCVLGAIAAVMVVINRATLVMLVFCYGLYLSLYHAGQLFMGYQWDVFLLEAGFLAIFLGNGSRIVVWLYRWLLFRFMFMGGMVKLLSGDESWRNLTALSYHYETQPLPTPLAWYMHQLPLPVHMYMTGAVLFIELLVPLLYFMPRNFRLVAALLTIVFEYIILLTGNYNFFNLLTILICLFLLDDRALRFVIPRRLAVALSESGRRVGRFAVWCAIPVTMLAVASGGLQMFTRISGAVLPESLNSFTQLTSVFGVVNSYGPFAVMTRFRPEIIIEGSRDGKQWKTYGFRYKVGDVMRRPEFCSPHQPRLDWQMWFAAYSSVNRQYWFKRFVQKLLEGSTSVLGLMERNPFPDSPPRFIRARLYEYHFTTAEERRESGDWWKREPLRSYMGPAHLPHYTDRMDN